MPALLLSLVLVAAPALARDEEPPVTGGEQQAGEAEEAPVAAEEEPTEASDWAAFGAPLLSYDSNLLLGLGAFGQVVVADNSGTRPFAASVAAQLYFTLGGYQHHYLRWDLPGIGGSPLRWNGYARYLAWRGAPYFGIGNDTPRLDDEDVDPGWYQWESQRFVGASNLRIPLGSSSWDVYISAIASQQGVILGTSSLLESDQPTGVAGGTLMVLGGGLFRDTRSNEIDPVDGSAIDFQLRASHPVLLSDWAWWGGHLSWRGWWEAVPDLVFAGRAMTDASFGDRPFFDQSWFAGLNPAPIGGRYLLRGLSEERLRGDGLAALQGELRWSFLRFTVLRTIDLKWMLVPFVDAARLWTKDEGLTDGLDLHLTGGAGLRVNVKGLLVLRGDVGYAIERYVDQPQRRGQVQFYLLGDHPF